MGAAVDRLLALTAVKGYTRVVNGKVVHVKPYNTKKMSKAEAKESLRKALHPTAEETLAKPSVHFWEDEAPESEFGPLWASGALSSNFVDVVREYMHEGSWSNERLRKGQPVDDLPVVGLDNALNSVRATKDYVTYRKITSASDEKWLPKHLEPGTVLSDKGYTSTSPFGGVMTELSSTVGSVIMRILVPQGTPGLYIPDALGQDEYKEGEVLLPRNGRMEVVSDLPDGAVSRYGKRRLITVKWLPS